MLATAFVLVVEIWQLDGKHGSLYLVKARVDADVREHILALRTIVAKRPYHLGKLGIVRCYGSGIAKGAKILARIEAVGSRIAKRASTSASVGAAVSLRIVLYKLEVVAAANVANKLGIGTAAVQMHYHYGTCTGRNGLLDKAIVYL